MFKRKRKMSAYDELIEEFHGEAIAILRNLVNSFNGTQEIATVAKIEYLCFAWGEARYYVQLERDTCLGLNIDNFFPVVVNDYIPKIGDKVILNMPIDGTYFVSKFSDEANKENER